MTVQPNNSTVPDLPGWYPVYSGKVRDLYVPDDTPEASLGHASVVLVVASDRVSAFDHVLQPGIPGKGELLTRLSQWWFSYFADVPNHLANATATYAAPDDVAARSMLVRPLTMFPVECVVRGYLSGTGWTEYRETGAVCGIPLPPGLRQGDQLPEPVFTPAWKAPLGAHDSNISFDRAAELVGEGIAKKLRDLSLEIYIRAAAQAADRGLILADTKFEFGADPKTGTVVLADEVLTPDSSRYWDRASWESGSTPQQRMASFDKQIIRDWVGEHWDGAGEIPRLEDGVIQRTAERYRDLVHRFGA